MIRGELGKHGVSLMVLVVGAAWSLSGCGGSDGRADQPEPPAKPQLVLTSPVVEAKERIPSQYRCRSKAVWLPLEWRRVPKGTVELILVSSRSRFIDSGERRKASLRGIEMIGGLKPDLRRLKVGQKPRGSFATTHDPNFCPPRSILSGIVFAVYAMPRKQHLEKLPTLFTTTLEGIEAASIASGSLPVYYGVEAGT
jgi:hypothetical protein